MAESETNNGPELPESRPLRIVSLIPSATDICVHLGLADSVVGITHCCDAEDLPASVLVVTRDQVDAASNSQGDIHAMVVENGRRAGEAAETSSALTAAEIPTLYPIERERLRRAAPNLIIAQDLCHVCAPSPSEVSKALREAGIDAEVVLLTPSTLWDVVDNLQQVADAAGISQKGNRLCDELRSNLRRLEAVVAEHRRIRNDDPKPKRMLVMEWVDPPFCGGHWIPDMARLIGAELAIDPCPDGRSRQITWDEANDADPDVAIVACCGLDLRRNLADARSSASSERLGGLRCHSEGNLYAANGDQYFARPSPKLLVGAVVMALCAYGDEPETIRAIRGLGFASAAFGSYERIEFF